MWQPSRRVALSPRRATRGGRRTHNGRDYCVSLVHAQHARWQRRPARAAAQSSVRGFIVKMLRRGRTISGAPTRGEVPLA